MQWFLTPVKATKYFWLLIDYLKSYENRQKSKALSQRIKITYKKIFKAKLNQTKLKIERKHKFQNQIQTAGVPTVWVWVWVRPSQKWYAGSLFPFMAAEEDLYRDWDCE